MSRSRVDSKKLGCAVTALMQRHDENLAARAQADAYDPHLIIDLSLHLPCAVSEDAGKDRRGCTLLCCFHRHNISLAEAGGTTIGST